MLSDQEKRYEERISAEFSSVSSSSRKLTYWKDCDDGTDDEDEYEDTSDEEYLCDSDKEELLCPKNSWIVDVSILQQYLGEKTVCKFCLCKIELHEVTAGRAGLATKFELICTNSECTTSHNENEGFNTSQKSGQVYDVNRKSVLAARLAGKGRRGLHKICSVLGLSSPINKNFLCGTFKVLGETSI